MPTLRYWDASTGQYVPIMVEGRKGPTGPAGPEGLAGTSGRPEVSVGESDPQFGEDLWVRPSGDGAALMTRSGDGWVPRHDMGGETVSSVGAPSSASDIATKGYVDSTLPAFDSNWVNLPYRGSWHSWPNSNPVVPARCRKTPDGVIIVEGNVTGGTVGAHPTGIVTVLPPGYRPAYFLHVHIYQDAPNNSFSRLSVYQSGELNIEGGSTLFQDIGFTFIAG